MRGYAFKLHVLFINMFFFFFNLRFHALSDYVFVFENVHVCFTVKTRTNVDLAVKICISTKHLHTLQKIKNNKK